MSQYGAYGYAKHGKGYRFILGHYYSGTRIAQLSEPRIVRVLLEISPEDVGFSGASSACGRALDPDRGYEAHRVGSSVQLRSSTGRTLATCGRRLRAAGDGTIEIAGTGTYRGALEVVPTDSDAGSLNTINALPVEQYVKGVIANESPPSWPAGGAARAGRGGTLLRPHRRRRRQRLRPLQRHPQPGLRRTAERDRLDQRRRDGDQGPGGDLRRRDRRDLLLGLLRRPHRERPERLLRPGRPLPGRRPRPLRLLLPPARPGR